MVQAEDSELEWEPIDAKPRDPVAEAEPGLLDMVEPKEDLDATDLLTPRRGSDADWPGDTPRPADDDRAGPRVPLLAAGNIDAAVDIVDVELIEGDSPVHI